MSLPPSVSFLNPCDLGETSILTGPFFFGDLTKIRSGDYFERCYEVQDEVYSIPRKFFRRAKLILVSATLAAAPFITFISTTHHGRQGSQEIGPLDRGRHYYPRRLSHATQRYRSDAGQRVQAGGMEGSSRPGQRVNHDGRAENGRRLQKSMAKGQSWFPAIYGYIAESDAQLQRDFKAIKELETLPGFAWDRKHHKLSASQDIWAAAEKVRPSH